LSSTTRTTLAESRCPELLAQYCDILLRKGTSTHKKYSSEEIEIKIKDVVGEKNKYLFIFSLNLLLFSYYY
jgi:hypothetical protein